MCSIRGKPPPTFMYQKNAIDNDSKKQFTLEIIINQAQGPCLEGGTQMSLSNLRISCSW